MRLKAALILLAVVGSSCQKSHSEKDKFQSTKLSVGVESSEASLNLGGSTQVLSAYVTKADLWCDDKLKASLDFTAEEQSVELFASLEKCELRLTEFVYGKVYKIGRLFSQGIFEFELRDEASNRLLDKKLVRSIQSIEVENKGMCKASCAPNEAHVTFRHSVLDIKNEILVNDINVNALYAKLEQEDAPSCDSLSAKFVDSGNIIIPPSLEIVLKNCTNTIGTSDLEFAFGPIVLGGNGQLPSPINVADVMNAVDNFPIIPVKNGNDYTISLSFEKLRDVFKGLDVSTIDILTFDFAVAIRNKQGISGLVYLIDNQCKASGSKI